MASDILLYNANLVPVGEDQKQHIELAKNISININKKINKNFFNIPKKFINKYCKKIKSLKNIKEKMSKSSTSHLSRINLSDNINSIKYKINKANTDSLLYINYDPIKRPEVSNLLDIYCGITNSNIQKIILQMNKKSISEFKDILIKKISNIIIPLHKKSLKIMKKKNYLRNIMIKGAYKARKIANNNIKNLKKILFIKKK